MPHLASPKLNPPRHALKGRGAVSNPKSRFDDTSREAFHDGWFLEEDSPNPETVILPDNSRSVLSRHDSPDLGHSQTLNPYRGCEHGCVYCYARPTHNHFGLSAGLDFETRLFAKYDIAALLARELSRANYRPQTIMLGGVTDAYQPVERRLKLTRAAIEILCETRHPFTAVTKSALAGRDRHSFAPAAVDGAPLGPGSATAVDRGRAGPPLPAVVSPHAQSSAGGALVDTGATRGRTLR
ncbi:MAG: radical SAM protein, partial [Alphaproteobacteria bacterium]|nr:radical SAM protein [Alphaproteobacteria bacterium]